MIIGFDFILFFLRKSKIQALFFFFFFMYPKSRQNKKGKWQMIPFSWEKTYFDKISSFYGLRVLTPTYVNHNQAPWCGPHLQVFLNLTQRNLHLRHIESWPQETQKKKKQKPKRENKKKKRGQVNYKSTRSSLSRTASSLYPHAHTPSLSPSPSL